MAAQDLTTLSAVRLFLQKPTADTGQDTIISALITRASDSIMRYAQREFAPATTSATRTFETDERGYLSLAPYDLRSVSSIRMDTDTSAPVTLTTDEYRLRPLPTVFGTYANIKLCPLSAHPNTRFAGRTVEVAGAWGFATIPEDVAHACILTVVEWLRDDVSAFSTAYANEAEPANRPESSIPQDARAVLAPYRRMAYV